MKVAVLNYSGNVGKSTVARYLLLPRIRGAELATIEIANARPGDNDAIDPSDYDTILTAVVSTDDLIIDVGASSVDEFLRQMRKFDGSIADFDYFIVPTIPDDKALRDTILTIAALNKLGAPPDRTVCLLNRVQNDATIGDMIRPLMRFHEESEAFRVDTRNYIHENEVFGRVTRSKATLEEITADQTDLRVAIKEAANDAERVTLIDRLATKRLATGVLKELNTVFSSIFAPAKQTAAASKAK